MCGFGNVGDERQPELYYHMNAGVWQIMNSSSLRRMRSSEGGIAPSCACMYPCVLHYAPGFSSVVRRRVRKQAYIYSARPRRPWKAHNAAVAAPHMRGAIQLAGFTGGETIGVPPANCVYPGWRRRPLSLWAASVHLQAPTDSSLC